MSASVVDDPKKERRLRVIRPSLPQVNLLPPEVRAARELRLLKRRLLIGAATLAIVCVGVLVAARLEVARAQHELTTAQAETASLQVEAGRFAEVPQVLGALDRATAARALGTSTEVLWEPYLDAITAVLPGDVSLESLTVTGATPMLAAAAPTDPLQAPSVGQIQFTGRTSTVPDTADWVDALESVPGFSDAWVSAISVGETAGATHYTVASTVQFTPIAYAGRFDVEGGGSRG